VRPISDSSFHTRHVTDGSASSGQLHEGAGPGVLRVVRGTVFGLWAAFVAVTPLHLWAELPTWAFSPSGVLRVVPEELWPPLLEPTVLHGFRFFLGALLAWCAVARAPSRALLLPAALGVVAFHGLLVSWSGYIYHTQINLMTVAMFLAVIDHRGAIERSERAGSSLFLAAILVSLTYFLIGVNRFLVGGLEVFTGDALPLYMIVRTVEPGTHSFQISYWLLQYTWILPFLKIGFFLTTVAEVLSPVALFHRRLRLAWLAVIVPFHVVTLFTMNIFFWENLILIALLFTNLPTRAEAWWKATR
jgi:hypothetical protein